MFSYRTYIAVTMKQAAAALVVLFLLMARGGDAVFLLMAHGGDAVYKPVNVEVTFDLLQEANIDILLQRLRAILVDNLPMLNFYGLPVLAPKDAMPWSPPGRFINVKFVAGTDQATLAFGDSNINLLGFQNSSGDWNCFDQYENLFAGGRSISFSGSYDDLVGGIENLPQLRLGRDAAIEALRVLSRYDPSITPDDDVMAALATFEVTVTEALRFTEIRQVIVGEWDQDIFLTEEQTVLLNAWEQVSECMFLWERDGTESRHDTCEMARRVGITSVEMAAAKVDLLKRPQVLLINSSVF